MQAFFRNKKNMAHNFKTIVPLEADELNFIIHKLQKEQHSFKSVFLRLVALGVFIPAFMLFLYHSVRGESAAQQKFRQTHFPDYYYLIAGGIILVIIFFSSIYSYWMTVRKIALDTKKKNKIVERTRILKKVFMPQTKTFHFYLDSKCRLSIEVNASDYSLYQEGDEINIEYSQYSGEYFGYF